MRLLAIKTERKTRKKNKKEKSAHPSTRYNPHKIGLMTYKPFNLETK
jgi:hypothetical protein